MLIYLKESGNMVLSGKKNCPEKNIKQLSVNMIYNLKNLLLM